MSHDDPSPESPRRVRIALYRLREERYRLYRELVKLLAVTLAAGLALARLVGIV